MSGCDGPHELVTILSCSKVACELGRPPETPVVALRSLVPGANTELVERARAVVEKAVRQNKVFVVFGQYNSVRRALKRRGWLEKPCDCCRVPRTAANAKVAATNITSHDETSLVFHKITATNI